MKQGNPLHDSTMVGAQASNDQMEKILSYIDIGKQEGAKVLIGGGRAKLDGGLENGFYVQPTVLRTTRCECSKKRSSGRCCRHPIQG